MRIEKKEGWKWRWCFGKLPGVQVASAGGHRIFWQVWRKKSGSLAQTAAIYNICIEEGFSQPDYLILYWYNKWVFDDFTWTQKLLQGGRGATRWLAGLGLFTSSWPTQWFVYIVLLLP